MMTKTPRIVFDFERDTFSKLGVRWICATCKHEVVPYKNPKLVTDIVEDVLFIDAATPYSRYNQLLL